MVKPIVEYANLGNLRGKYRDMNVEISLPADRFMEATALEALALRLSVDEESLSAHRLRFPDGTLIYTPRFCWCLLVKAVIELFCGRFVPNGVVLYVNDTGGKVAHCERDALSGLGFNLAAPEKMPDVVVHDTRRNWLVLVEAVTSAGPVDMKRRQELAALFSNSKAGLVYVTAFATREAMRSFLADISWETEVWIASAPDHLIHFNGERFLGPYGH